MYIKVHEHDVDGRNKADYLMFECSTYKIEHIRQVENHEGFSFFVGAPAAEQPPEQPQGGAVLRLWDRSNGYQDALIYSPASGYVMNDQGATVDRFHV